eukprot:GHRR01006363.1.p1 GENE.GHRR01006363.1~~GHRR01006363.1.p1  ORF type:complete len:476 (+),score=185.34 GHRR01006363.1:2625-4052(+)
MVRFHWHVEDGAGAFSPPGAMTYHKETGVQHVICHIEVPGERPPAQAFFTVPAGYMTEGKVRDIGIVLGHGDKAEDWQGTLLTEIAVTLAQAGYVVVRYLGNTTKELRRQRMFEKALDACATSPFARFVQRWVLGGIGHGARLAAIVGQRARGTVCGYVFMSYPLTEPLQTAKGPLLPDSSILLLRIPAPTLFFAASKDSKAPANQIRTVAAQMKPAADVRLVEVPNVDGSFQSGEPPAVQQETVTAVTQPLLEFVNSLQSNSIKQCKLQHACPLGQAPVPLSDSAAAGIAAQIALLDEDDSLIYELEPFGTSSETGPAGPGQAMNVQQHAQHLLQQQAQLQLQALHQQQAQLAAAAAKAGISLQQAAVHRAVAAGQQGFALTKLPAGVSGVPAAGGAVPSSGPVVGPVMLGGLPAGLLAGGLTSQMLAAAQAMAAAAGKQGIRPGAGTQLVLPAGAAVAAQQQLAQQEAGKQKG